jgi:hypothetical protein
MYLLFFVLFWFFEQIGKRVTSDQNSEKRVGIQQQTPKWKIKCRKKKIKSLKMGQKNDPVKRAE